jgi:drug/metabolite transporter (DMT)-like permease
MSEFSSSRAHLWPGVPLALASAILFGASAPFAKLLLGSVDPQLLAGLLYLGAGTGLVVVHVVRRLIGLEAPASTTLAINFALRGGRIDGVDRRAPLLENSTYPEIR